MKDIIRTFRQDLFAGQTVLLSGATSGIGLAMAQGFRDLGADVICTGTSVPKIEKARTVAANAKIRFEQLDVRDSKGIHAFVSGLPRLDVLVNAAGIARRDKEFEEDVYLDVVDVNLHSVMRLSMAARPLLAKTKGSIINIASMLSYIVDPAFPAYGASKTGMIGLTRHLAFAFGKEGIRVNALSPGYIKTELTTASSNDPVLTTKILNRCAIKRWGEVDDCVGAALYLASPAAAFITGADLPVDGGFVVGGF
jgi:NAD(P)-dependent dehydrogenase (short-subunit alcohol dehydrogenase family)